MKNHVTEQDLQRALGAVGITGLNAIWEASDYYRAIPKGFADRYAELRKGGAAKDTAAMTVREEATAPLSDSADGSGQAEVAIAV